MGVTLEMQLEFFIWSIITGLFSGFLYDIFRLARKLTNPKAGTIIFHDILFLVFAAIVVSVLSFTAGRGEVRLFEFVGIFFGFVLYRFAFKDSVVKVLEKLVKFFAKLVIFIVKIVLFPLVFIYKILKKPIGIIVWYTRKSAVKTGLAVKIRRERFSRGLKNFVFAVRKK